MASPLRTTGRHLRRLSLVVYFALVVGGLLWGGCFFLNRPQTEPNRILDYFALILRGIADYDDVFEQFPPPCFVDDAGRPLFSWRFRVLTLLTSSKLDFYTNERWDGPHNAEWAKFAPLCYCFLSRMDTPEARNTNVMAICGPDTAFDDKKMLRIAELPTDTILIVEVRDSGVHWMECGDLDTRNIPQAIGKRGGIAGSVADEFCVGFADGQVWLMRSDVPFDLLSRFFTISGSRDADRDERLTPYMLRTRRHRDFPVRQQGD